MTGPTPARNAASPLARALRYAYRVPLLLWHLAVDLPLTLLLMTPLTRNVRIGDEPLEYRVIRLWQSGLMRIVGFHPRREGTPLPGAVVFVANHVSWIDISALHSQRMMGFVAKREISRWPLVGWMAWRGETIFHERGSSESLGGVLHEMLARLRDGRSVGVFPEGRTRDGREIGPFHARIFLAAVEAGARVQPVALRYGEHGAAQATVAFAPGESFVANFFRVLGEPARRADIVFLEPIDTGDAGGRRRIADLARERIIEAMSR